MFKVAFYLPQSALLGMCSEKAIRCLDPAKYITCQSEPSVIHSSAREPAFYTSLLGYSTLVVAPNSSFKLLMLTNLPMIAALPALSFVPDARAPPNGC